MTLETRKKVVSKLKGTMSDGKYPINDQHSANSAWDLRNNSTTHSAADVIAHIRQRVADLGLKMPSDSGSS